LAGSRILKGVTAAAVKAVIALQLAHEMKRKKITKQRVAKLMKASRAQVDRLLDSKNGPHRRPRTTFTSSREKVLFFPCPSIDHRLAS